MNLVNDYQNIKIRFHNFKQVIALLVTLTSSNIVSANDKMIETSTGSIHALSAGQGKYTVIFEAGFGSNMMHWRKVAPILSEQQKIFAYSRIGSGKSSKMLVARQLHESISDFEDIVKIEGLKPPYILVGHSYGAMISRGFAEKNPKDVAGIVLVDPYNPSLIKELKKVAPHETKTFLKAYQNMIPQHLKNEQKVLTAIEEKGSMPKFGQLPNIPAVVITSMKKEHPQFIIHSDKGKKIWKNLHTKWFNDFSVGRHEIITSSGHNIAIEAPETVIESIQYVIEQANIKARIALKDMALKNATIDISNKAHKKAEVTIFSWLSNSKMTTEQINSLGYTLLNKKEDMLSSIVLKFNVIQKPRLANAYDSYGEALTALKLYKKAKIQFEIAARLAKEQGMSTKIYDGFLSNITKIERLLDLKNNPSK
jgi:pimeloyl-ACP methyl ester carboxylesterase